MKKSELRQIIKEEISKVAEKEAFAKRLTNLYNKAVMMDDVDDEALDIEMEDVIEKIGYTSGQQKKKGAYRFAFGDHPEWEKLSDKQMRELELLLKAVNKRKRFTEEEMWDGTKIVKNPEYDEFDEFDDEY